MLRLIFETKHKQLSMSESTSPSPTAEVASPTAEVASAASTTTATATTIHDRITFRQVIPADIPACFDIESNSYPPDEAASKSSLQYRQHHAEKYFRCAVLDEDEDDESIVGFICATRCVAFDSEATMETHDTAGSLLAIHSVVVSEKYRHLGIATAMMEDYVKTMETSSLSGDGVETFVLLAKADLLVFYVQNCGFAVMKPSTIVHGKEQWFHLERRKDNNIDEQPTGKKCWVVDSFTDTAGKGNPAAVVLLEEEPEDNEATIAWFQTVAREFNLSETAFVWKLTCLKKSAETSMDESIATDDDDDDNIDEISNTENNKYRIRYFTANGTEVDLCGHATLASAAVLFQELPSATTTEIIFCANKDELIMTPEGSNQIAMNFPQKIVTELLDEDYSAVLDMLERTFPKVASTLENNILYIGLDQDSNDVLVEMSPECLDSLGYDGILYDQLDWADYQRGVIVCSVAAGDSDFWSRFFGPKAGINEDPVTGSAHCTLAPYFGQKLNKTVNLQAEQRSVRGGTVDCTLVSRENNERRVTLVGSAVITLSGSTWI